MRDINNNLKDGEKGGSLFVLDIKKHVEGSYYDRADKVLTMIKTVFEDKKNRGILNKLQEFIHSNEDDNIPNLSAIAMLRESVLENLFNAFMCMRNCNNQSFGLEFGYLAGAIVDIIDIIDIRTIDFAKINETSGSGFDSK